MKQSFWVGLLALVGMFVSTEVRGDIVVPPQCRVKAVVKSGKGSVSGAGTYAEGRTVTLKAKAASGYRFLRWDACCMPLDEDASKSATLKFRVYDAQTVSAYFKKKPALVKPSAGDGKSSEYVKLTWKKASGAVSYKIRRGRSSDYAKSKVVGSTAGTSYIDYCCPEEANGSGKFYYWVMSVDSTGKAFVSKSKYDVGYPKNLSKISGAGTVVVGESYSYRVKTNCSEGLSGAFKWKIVSGGTCATISSRGVLKAKKAGKVVIQAVYRGKTMKRTITIKKACTDCELRAP